MLVRRPLVSRGGWAGRRMLVRRPLVLRKETPFLLLQGHWYGDDAGLVGGAISHDGNRLWSLCCGRHCLRELHAAGVHGQLVGEVSLHTVIYFVCACVRVRGGVRALAFDGCPRVLCCWGVPSTRSYHMMLGVCVRIRMRKKQTHLHSNS